VKHNVFSILHFHAQNQILPDFYTVRTPGSKTVWITFSNRGSARPPEKCHFSVVRNFIVAGLIFLRCFSDFHRTEGAIQSNQQQQGAIKKHGNYSIVLSPAKPKGGKGEPKQNKK
jgi:hypothetical protein